MDASLSGTGDAMAAILAAQGKVCWKMPLGFHHEKAGLR
jgi:hypothetical protein